MIEECFDNLYSYKIRKQKKLYLFQGYNTINYKKSITTKLYKNVIYMPYLKEKTIFDWV